MDSRGSEVQSMTFQNKCGASKLFIHARLATAINILGEPASDGKALSFACLEQKYFNKDISSLSLNHKNTNKMQILISP